MEALPKIPTTVPSCPRCGAALRVDEIDRDKTYFQNGLQYSLWCRDCLRQWDTDRPEKYNEQA